MSARCSQEIDRLCQRGDSSIEAADARMDLAEVLAIAGQTDRATACLTQAQQRLRELAAH